MTAGTHSLRVRRMGLKVFARDPDRVDRAAVIPIFHRWIRDDTLGRLVIDVADYRHVYHGPGVMLLAHQGQYAMDEAEGRLGLRYDQLGGTTGDPVRDVRDLFRATYTACLHLEREQTLRDAVRFRSDVMRFYVADRLAAPDTDTLLRRWNGTLAAQVADLYGGTSFAINPHDGDGVSLDITIDRGVDLAELVSRCG